MEWFWGAGPQGWPRCYRKKVVTSTVVERSINPSLRSSSLFIFTSDYFQDCPLSCSLHAESQCRRVFNLMIISLAADFEFFSLQRTYILRPAPLYSIYHLHYSVYVHSRISLDYRA